MNIKTSSTLLAGLLTAVAAPADILAEWDVSEAGGGVSSLSAINVASGLSASELSATGVNLLAASSYSGSFCASGWSIGDFGDTYYSFIVTGGVDGIQLESIELSLCRGYYGGTAGAENWNLEASFNNFADSTELASFDISNSETNEQVKFSTDFYSAINLDAGETVEFRLYGYYPESSSDFSGLTNMESRDYDGDPVSGTGSNVILHGNIPEPAAVCLICGTGLSIFFIRRIFDA